MLLILPAIHSDLVRRLQDPGRGGTTGWIRDFRDNAVPHQDPDRSVPVPRITGFCETATTPIPGGTAYHTGRPTVIPLGLNSLGRERQFRIPIARTEGKELLDLGIGTYISSTRVTCNTVLRRAIGSIRSFSSPSTRSKGEM